MLNDNFNAKWTNMQKHFYVGAGETITVLCRDTNVYGNLIIFSSFFVIPAYKSVVMVMSGNGNNTNPGQPVTIYPLVESSLVTYARVDVSGRYNEITITNSGTYGIYVNATTLYGMSPTKY